jgi:hypothetical protein
MRELVAHNFGLKAISLLFSVVIWYKFSFDSAAGAVQQYVRAIELVNTDPTLSVTCPPDRDRAVVTIWGRRIDLVQVDRSLRAILDLKNVRSPIGDVSLKVEALVPPGLAVEVRKIEPAVVRVAVRPAASRLRIGPDPTPKAPARAPGALAAHGAAPVSADVQARATDAAAAAAIATGPPAAPRAAPASPAQPLRTRPKGAAAPPAPFRPVQAQPAAADRRAPEAASGGRP